VHEAQIGQRGLKLAVDMNLRACDRLLMKGVGGEFPRQCESAVPRGRTNSGMKDASELVAGAARD
jgi:hypothetical protein